MAKTKILIESCAKKIKNGWRTTSATVLIKDPFVKNQKELRKSWKKLLNIADYIVPGREKMFKIANKNKINKTKT
jgi:hypothetical protein